MKATLFLVLILVVISSGCTQTTDEQLGKTQNQTPRGGGEITDDFLDEALTELELTEDLPEEIVKEFEVTARQWEFVPGSIEVNKGDRVILHVESIDVTHGIWIPEFGINEKLEPGKTVTIDFVADREGTFPLICSVFCGDGHFQMKGKLIVK